MMHIASSIPRTARASGPRPSGVSLLSVFVLATVVGACGDEGGGDAGTAADAGANGATSNSGGSTANGSGRTNGTGASGNGGGQNGSGSGNGTAGGNGNGSGGSTGGAEDGGGTVELSAVAGVTVWGASEQDVLFVGDIDPDEPDGVARDPEDPFASGVYEISLPSPIAQGFQESNQRTVLAVEGAAWAVLRDRTALVRAERADLSATTLPLEEEIKAVAGDDTALFVAMTTGSGSSSDNVLVELDSESGAERDRISLGYDSNEGGPLMLLASDDDFVAASHQNGPSEVHVMPRSDLTSEVLLGPFDGLIRGLSLDGGRVYVATAGDLVSDPHTLTVLDAASGDVLEENIEMPSQRMLIHEGLVAVGSGATQSGESSYVGATSAFGSLTALDTSASVTDLEHTGSFGLLLLQNGTLVFDASTFEVLFESELFGRVGDIYLP